MSCEVLPGGEPLIERVRAEAGEPAVQRIRLALGYLFVPGLAPVWDALEASCAAEIHLLIGNTAGVLSEEERVAAAAAQPHAVQNAVAPEMDMAAGARADRDRIVAETAHALRENLRDFPRDGENDRFLLSLARAVGANRLRVRIYPDSRLHAKASLFERTAPHPSMAIAGSSNLTLPSPGNPTEMNVVLYGDAAQSVARWFDRLWDAGQDFTRPLFVELSQRVAV